MPTKSVDLVTFPALVPAPHVAFVSYSASAPHFVLVTYLLLVSHLVPVPHLVPGMF